MYSLEDPGKRPRELTKKGGKKEKTRRRGFAKSKRGGRNGL